MGIHKAINKDVKAGISYSYTDTDVDAYRRNIDVKSHTFIAYGEYKPSNWFVNGIASYGMSDYDEHKKVFGGVKADYDVKSYGLQAMTGYDACVRGLNVTPQAGLRYHSHQAEILYRYGRPAYFRRRYGYPDRYCRR